MGSDVFYPDNPKREKRLKDICEQIKTSEDRVFRWDREMSQLGQKIGQRLKKLQSYCAEVVKAIDSMGLGNTLRSPRQLLNWVQNYSSQHKISNNGAIKVCQLVIDIFIIAAASLTGLGAVAGIAISAILNVFFGAILGAVERSELRKKTSQALGYRKDYKKNELRCQQAMRALTQIQSKLAGFQTAIDILAPRIEKDPSILQDLIDELQLVEYIEATKRRMSSIGDRETRLALYEMDRYAPFRDMEVEDSYSDLRRAYSRSVKTPYQLFMDKQFEEFQKEYLEKSAENQVKICARTRMKGVEKFCYGKIQANINKSIFALWGIYDAASAA